MRRGFLPLALPEFDEGEPDLTPRPASASATVLSQMMEIEHANNAGNVHGGTILRLVDGAAGIAAIKHARRRVVTAAIDEMSFLAPVFIGDVLTVRAMVNDAHRSSMEIGVKVMTEKLLTGERLHTCSAYLTFVAVDREGRAIAVAPVIPETEDEIRRYRQAGERREYRLAMRNRLKT